MNKTNKKHTPSSVDVERKIHYVCDQCHADVFLGKSDHILCGACGHDIVFKPYPRHVRTYVAR